MTDNVSYSDMPRNLWTPLRYLNGYRVIIAGFMVMLAFAEVLPGPDPNNSPDLFESVAVIYLALGVVIALSIRLRVPAFPLQVFGQGLVDVALLTLLMHGAGGVRSGFGILLLVAVAGASILASGRIAIFLAAMATLAILSEQFWLAYTVGEQAAAYRNSGYLGAGLFTSAALSFFAASRLRDSEALAARREVDLANLAKLNEQIIHRMQSGIIATDGIDRVRLMNEAARNYLGIADEVRGRTLEQLVPELQGLALQWREDPSRSKFVLDTAGNNIELNVSFAGIDGRLAADGLLVFLEDSAAVRQRAQQLNLVSLGRLTASIAHEIRNPLGAISHAGQLLEESGELPASDRRLTGIIRDNSVRVNAIVESVLRLSRRNAPIAEEFDLVQWLLDFQRSFVLERSCEPGAVTLSRLPKALPVRFDKGQLRQVVGNLIDNALRHAGQPPQVRLMGGLHESTQRPFLEVRDNGQGVEATDRAHLFEPFFTTAPTGTGLGLYIARELARANQASLKFQPESVGACFRLNFPHPKSRGVAVK